MEDLRRRRRSLLGRVRYVPPAEIRLDRPNQRPRPLEARRASPSLMGALLSLPILSRWERHWASRAAGAAAHTVGAWFAACSPTGTAIISCQAQRLPSGWRHPADAADLHCAAAMEEIAAIAFGRKPSRLIVGASAGAGHACAQGLIHIPAYREPPEMLSYARFGGAARISEFRMHRYDQQHARPGVLAADRGALQNAR